MPGAAITMRRPCAAASFGAAPTTAHKAAAAIASISLRFTSVSLLCPCALIEQAFGRSRLAHERAPDVLAQFGEARLTQRVAGARARQVDLDGFMDVARAPFEHHNAVPQQHRLLDRVRDEEHRCRALVPDAQQFELQDLPRL